MRGILILARHHESEWNKIGKWQGMTDTHLTSYGLEKAFEMGQYLKSFKIDLAVASGLARTKESLEKVLAGASQEGVSKIFANELNERDYGDYTGLNKWEIKEKVGEEEFKNIRRGWNHPIPGGETLEKVSERSLPFFLEKVLPELNVGKNVLIIGHGNNLRTLVKYIEKITDDQIADVDFPFGSIVFYTLDSAGHILTKEIKNVESKVNA
jgi:2,3-bisphosphoglycerate-dependent phosphoglycerate mutase